MVEESILVINAGSSSLKFGLYSRDPGRDGPVLEGSADDIGSRGKLEIRDDQGRLLRHEELSLNSEGDAADHVVKWLAELAIPAPCAIGHRVVHSGPRLKTHQPITPGLIEELRSCVHFAPLHISVALDLIARSARAYPGVPQFACFDTAFHQEMPELAARLPLPRDLFDEGVRRYGFHGLSYESIVCQLGDDLPSRMVIAHLGNGASLAALRDGRSVDTTMAFTPTGGIPMATRSGDLDPGVLLYLMRAKRMNADSIEALLNRDSGLAGLSEGKQDMRDLEAAADSGDREAQLAIDVFCTSIRKTVASYTAVLGGLDMLVFTGGIGEHSARIRNSVCGGLAFLGIWKGGTVRVETIPSQEDRQIARHCRAMLKEAGSRKQAEI